MKSIRNSQRATAARPIVRLVRGIFIGAACSLVLFAQASSVKIREQSLTIPTYQAGGPDPAPLFYEGRTYQGAKGPIYPYPIVDTLTSVRAPKTYKGVYLENEYVKICVLPEIGGRIFEAVDKTNNYDFFYRQHVIKPALIGMLGAWISGGVEWNIPHHHRASSFMPVEYKLAENADGSKTIWVGEMELRHRMRWMVGLTLHPGKSYLEATVKLLNRTPLVHSFLYFANVAVHTNPNYQIIFPPSAEFATQHSKSEFSRWPIGSGIYAGQDFKGVDVSWWKNHRRPISMFAHNSTEDFLAGYDHGRKAGTLHVGDHGAVNGKKFFTWGVGSDWDNMLTDADGPYLELMVGAYSDNQPDYSWAQPYEVKVARQFWYPFQQIGGVKNANLEGAVNLEVTPQRRARVGFATTSARPRATALLEAGGKALLNETIAIAPGKPFFREIALPEGVREEDLRARLVVAGKDVVSYRPVRREQSPMPSPVEPPRPPQEIKTNEELYLTGLRLEQFYSPAMEPDPYYEEALRRDPSDYKVNTALGILYLRRGRFQEAEQRLRAAVDRVTRNYTNPKDGEPLYYLGLALKAQHKYDQAYEVLYRASWSYAWHTASFYALAEIAGQRGDCAKAVEFLDGAIATNALNTKALLLKSAFLRRMERFDEAAQVASAAAAIDPLDRWGARELRLAKTRNADNSGPRGPILNNLDDNVQAYLEMAVDYGNAGLWGDGVSALSALIGAYPDRSRVYPMVYYYLGYLSEKLGKTDQSSEYFRLAARMPSDYCFPFRLESIDVLRRAMANNPADARAPYYLGNLLYDLQPEAAIREWEKARGLDPRLALAARNLGWAYARAEPSLEKAIANMEAAVAQDPRARFLFELDRLYEAAGAAPARRLALLEKHHDRVLDRDDALEREIRLSVLLGKYDRALELLANRRFHSWEGGARFSVHASYIDAHLLRGDKHLGAGDLKKALADYSAALKFPENLSAAEYYQGEKSAQIYYSIGAAYEKLGDRDKARDSFQAATTHGPPARQRRGGTPIDFAEAIYYQGLAYDRLGQRQQAADLFARLLEMGQGALRASQAVDFFAKFGERQTRNARLAQGHYALGLAHASAGRRAEAKAEFEEALKLNVNHLGAQSQLAALGRAGGH